ncbi:MAG: transcriptional repressor [Anaerolineae bacterium]|nr:transcriptional repressor [Anaerolineae bacterium]
MTTLEMLIELFRQGGRKITPQRRVILELLSQEGMHPTAEEVYRQIAETMPDVSRATVYNTLRELIALGGLTEAFDFGNGGLRYDTNTEAHHHLFCTRCHTLMDIQHEFAGLALPPEKRMGYVTTHYQVTFYGLCPACQKQERAEDPIKSKSEMKGELK